MTKEFFKPILIGKRTDRIESETASWMQLISESNKLFANWNLYFDEKLDLKELAIVLNTPDLKFYIQEKHVRKNPKHAEFLKTMSVKIEKLIDFVEFPSFDHLIESVSQVKSAIYIDQVKALKERNAIPGTIKKSDKPDPVGETEFEVWKNKIFNGDNFELIPELEELIIARHSVYTKSIRENAAYLYMVRLSDTLNMLNDFGWNFNRLDYPRFVFSQLDSFPSDRNHSELKFNRGESRLPIMHFRPDLQILKADSQILSSMRNLSDTEIEHLIEKLK